MGQQQLMLVVLSVVIVGIAVAVGINLFRESAVSSARDALVTDLNAFGARAQAYYRRPKLVGGGGYSFDAITIFDLTQSPNNENGRYYISSKSSSQVEITGIGKEVVGNDSLEVRVLVTADSLALTIIN
ncbi:MAG: hypothetical protein ACE5H0_13750 [Bacteroidota bacterium]